jgi:hypothetical protein
MNGFGLFGCCVGVLWYFGFFSLVFWYFSPEFLECLVFYIMSSAAVAQPWLSFVAKATKTSDCASGEIEELCA